MPATINILEIIELKKTLDEKFDIKMHIHDACGGQYFSTDNLNPAGKKYIIDYFKNKNYQVIFTSNDTEFYLEDIRTC